MRVGLIVRESKTGLGHQTLEIWRHLRPAVTVAVILGGGREGPRADWYGDVTRVNWVPGAVLPGAYDQLATCDVVLSAETFYDWTLPETLATAGVPTVLIANPELYDGHWTSHVWAPTTWHRRAAWRHVPHPAPFDRYPTMVPLAEPLTVVHPSSTAMLDRNGTEPARRARRLGHWPLTFAGPLGTHYENYWDRDPGMAMSVIPRRYGGLCLPAFEAMSAGVPVLMPAITPNTDWPIVELPHVDAGAASMKGGRFALVDCKAEAINRVVSALLTDRERLEYQRRVVRRWAEHHSWEALMPEWVKALEDAASVV